MMGFDGQVEALVAQIDSAPGMHRLRQLCAADLDAELLGTMLSEASRLLGAQAAAAPESPVKVDWGHIIGE